jgi:hypothetical protein
MSRAAKYAKKAKRQQHRDDLEQAWDVAIAMLKVSDCTVPAWAYCWDHNQRKRQKASMVRLLAFHGMAQVLP